MDPVHSKNDIFLTSHAVLKPAIKMSEMELQALKAGLPFTSGDLSETMESLDLNQLSNASPALSVPSLSRPSPAIPEPCTKHDISANQLEQWNNIQMLYLPAKTKKLGEGRYAQVFRGQYFCNDTPMDCAIKQFYQTIDAQEKARNEVYLLSQMRHLNIVHFIAAKENDIHQDSEYCVLNQRLIILLELCSRGNLWSMVETKKVTQTLFLNWAHQLASGVKYMHDLGIVHHDIKPHNILMREDGTICLADFGNALTLPSFNGDTIADNMLYDGLGLGTTSYTAPEILNKRPYSLPIDIYSLGVTFYVFITGMEPFTQCRNNIHLITSIKRGFFESGMQVDPYPEGPSYGVFKYCDGNIVQESVISLLRSMVSLIASERPTAAFIYEMTHQWQL